MTTMASHKTDVSSPATDVTVTTTENGSSETQLHGDQVTYTADRTDTSHVSGTWPAEADEHVRKLINEAQAEREAIEEHRADRRNRNRLLTLAFAIVIGIIVTYFFQNDGFPVIGVRHVLPAHMATILYGYSFVVTVTLDASLALYAYVKKF
jgi:hypothetical protein